MEEKENLFKCPNDLRVTIKKDNGELVLDEDCCTNLSILIKNSGEMATSFLGAHSPEMIKVLEKTLRRYFKTIKKTLKNEYKREDNEDILVVKGDSETNSPEIEEALAKEVEVDIKYEFDSLKEIEKVVENKGKSTKLRSNTKSKTSNKKSIAQKPTTKQNTKKEK